MKDALFLIFYFLLFIKKVINKRRRFTGKYNKIACVSWQLIGDTFLTLPIIESLSKYYPGCSLTVICKPEMKELLNKIIEVNNVISIGDNDFFKIDTLRLLRTQNYDLVIDFTNHKHSAFLTFFLKAKFKIGGSGIYELAGLTFRGFPMIYDDVIDPPGNQYVTDYLAGICKILIPKFTYSKEHRYFSNIIDSRPQDKLDVQLKKMKIGFAIGASRKENLWLGAYWGQLANYLISKHNAAIYLFGGDNDTENAENILNFTSNGIVSYVGKLSLINSIEKISHMNYFVTNDTGLMHISIQLGIPTISLVGPSDYHNYIPTDNIRIKIVHKKLFCSPCYRYLRLKEWSVFTNCKKDAALCKRLISTEDVITQFEDLIKNE